MKIVVGQGGGGIVLQMHLICYYPTSPSKLMQTKHRKNGLSSFLVGNCRFHGYATRMANNNVYPRLYSNHYAGIYTSKDL